MSRLNRKSILTEMVLVAFLLATMAGTGWASRGEGGRAGDDHLQGPAIQGRLVVTPYPSTGQNLDCFDTGINPYGCASYEFSGGCRNEPTFGVVNDPLNPYSLGMPLADVTQDNVVGIILAGFDVPQCRNISGSTTIIVQDVKNFVPSVSTGGFSADVTLLFIVPYYQPVKP